MKKNKLPETSVSPNKNFLQSIVAPLLFSVRTWAFNSFVLPFRMDKTLPAEERMQIIYRSVFNILSVLILFVMPIMSLRYGITGDEHLEHDNGTKIYNYFFHGDDSAQQADPVNQMQYYGGAFSFIVAFFYYVFHFRSYYTVMHFFNALAGAIGIIYAGKFGKLLDSWLTAILTMVILILSPSWFGHNFANPKDIPFCVGYIVSFYFITLFLKSLPNATRRNFWGLVCSFGFCMGVHIGGLLLFPYFIVFTLSYILLTDQWKSLPVSKLLRKMALVCVLGYLLALVCWPYSHLDIIDKPFETLKMMSNVADHSQDIGMTYEGRYLPSRLVPWYYIPKYILLTAPIIVLSGFVIGCVALAVLLIKDKKKGLPFLYLLLCATLPVLYAIAKQSALYDGWRHFLFIYPPLAIIAAFGWSALLRSKNKMISYPALALLVAGLFLPLRYSFANHPYEYLYFNEIAGGVKNINGKYETDYYMLGIRDATEWLIKNEHLEDKKVIIATNCIFPLMEYVKPYKNLQTQYVKLYKRDSKDWNYCVLYSRFVSPSQIVSGNWPPPETIHTVNVEGVPIAVVLKRKTKLDIPGFEYVQANKMKEAKTAFLNSLKEYPDNMLVWEQLANIYEDEGSLDSAIYAAQIVLKQYPGNFLTCQLIGRCYIKQNKPAEALRAFVNLRKYDEEYGHYLLAFYYGMTGNKQKGYEEIDSTILVNKYNDRAYKLGVKLAKKYNDSVMGFYYSGLYKELFAAKEQAEQE